MAFGGDQEHTFKNVGKKPNSWTDREQLWHTYAYSSGNGHELTMALLRLVRPMNLLCH